MLCGSPVALHARQRQHRRQNSTPSAFAGAKIQPLLAANVYPRQSPGHRRHLSLDTRQSQPIQASPTRGARWGEHWGEVGSAANQGLTSPAQHQSPHGQSQQNIAARPDMPYPSFVPMTPGGDDPFFISPHGTPQSQGFMNSWESPGLGPVPFVGYGNQLDMMAHRNLNNYSAVPEVAESPAGFDVFGPESAVSTPTFFSVPESPTGSGWTSEGDTASTKMASRRISNGIMDRVHRYETLSFDDAQNLAIRPPSAGANGYFPSSPSPVDVAQEPMAKQQQRPARFAEGYDESMEETIKPTRNRGNLRTQDIFQHMRQQHEQVQQQEQVQQTASVTGSPQGPGPVSGSHSFSRAPLSAHGYMDMASFDFNKVNSGYDGDMSHETAAAAASTTATAPVNAPVNAPAGLSQESTPNVGPFVGGMAGKPDLQPYGTIKAPQSNSPSRQAPAHRRNDSMASIASAASIAHLDIEASKTDTGITPEQIEEFIKAPDESDPKWTCTFPGCQSTKFGRKENIKSHIQTHLNDRQYKCPDCQKCFVRQHDLKRHAKIHSGDKPYKCACAASFARQDALTRHRQRGMCVGAFEGVVRKDVKRGRPKKNRPDMEMRQEKSAKTRKRNDSSSTIPNASQESFTDSSAANTPGDDSAASTPPADGFDFNAPLDGFAASPDDTFNMTVADMGTMSPGPSQNMAVPMSSAPMYQFVPSVAATPEYISPEAIMERSPSSYNASPAKSVGSQYNTPPELSQSSSPPAGHFFESDPMTSAGMEATLSPSMSGSNDQGDDIIIPFSDDSSMVQLSNDASYGMGKFNEEFDNGVNTYARDDLFDFFDTSRG
jgi:regulatory protein SWI5